jgi:hypothetical protein
VTRRWVAEVEHSEPPDPCSPGGEPNGSSPATRRPRRRPTRERSLGEPSPCPLPSEWERVLNRR